MDLLRDLRSLSRALPLAASAILIVACSQPAPSAPAGGATSAPAAAATTAPAESAATSAPAAGAATSAPAAGAATSAPAGATSAPAAAGATSAPAAAASPDQTLIMAFGQSDVKTLDPGREFEFAAAFIVLNTYDTLVVPKSNTDFSTFVPHVAKDIKISPDGTEYTFTLRDDIKFASGNPLTADDVKFSLLRLKNLKGNPGWMMDPLKDVQVVDPHTVKTILNAPFADWLAVLGGPNAAIMDSKLAMEHGASASATADKDDKAEEWLSQNSAGSGPFILTGWQKNQGMSLKANPNYFLGAPKLAAVEVRDVPSPATQQLQIQNGDVDVAINLTPDLVATMRDNPNVKIITGQSMDEMYMGLTCDPAIDPHLAKKEVRQAIRSAVDYDGVLALTDNQAIRGPVVQAIGMFGLTAEDAEKMNPKYDPDKAKQLLQQAGEGNGFSFKLEYGTGPSPVGITYESVAQKIQSDLKKVNIDVQLAPMEFGEMLSKYRNKTEAAVISYNQPDYLGPADNIAQMIEGTWAPRLHYTSDKAMDLAKKSDAELDPQKRIDLLHQAYMQLLDDGPYVMLVQGKINVVTSPKIQGYEYIPIGTTRLWGVSKSS